MSGNVRLREPGYSCKQTIWTISLGIRMALTVLYLGQIRHQTASNRDIRPLDGLQVALCWLRDQQLRRMELLVAHLLLVTYQYIQSPAVVISPMLDSLQIMIQGMLFRVSPLRSLLQSRVHGSHHVLFRADLGPHTHKYILRGCLVVLVQKTIIRSVRSWSTFVVAAPLEPSASPLWRDSELEEWHVVFQNQTYY
jgi:hypothetical protein